MPDLSIEYMYQCESLSYSEADAESSSGSVYRLRRLNGQWECPCQGFKFRKTCKHVEEARKQACSWHQQVDDGEPVETPEGKRCPKCGGPAEVVRVAV